MPITTADVRRLAQRRLGTGTMRHRINLLGVGGVGSNVLKHALHKEIAPRVMFRIYDPDTIELHNLTRSRLFHLAQVGAYKVTAAHATILKEMQRPVRRGDTQEEARAFLRGFHAGEVDRATSLLTGMIVDARDTMDPSKMVAGTWVKLAYNGGSELSLTWRPDLVADRLIDLGGRSAYEVVPSFFVPAAMLAVLAFNFMRFLNFLEIPEGRAGTYQLDLDRTVSDLSYVWLPAPAESGSDAEAPVEQGRMVA